MLKQQSRLLTKIAVLIDTVMIMAAFYVAYVIMSRHTSLSPLITYDWILLLMIPVWLLLLWHYNLYASLRIKKISDLLTDLLKVHLIGSLILSSAIYILGPRGFSRLFFSGVIITTFLFISFAKSGVKLILYYLRIRGYNTRYILLVGCTESAAEFIKMINHHPGWGIIISGIFEEDPHSTEPFYDIPVVGTIDDITTYCKTKPVDEVIWCLNHHTELQENTLYNMLQMGITFHSILDYSTRPTTRADLSLFHGQFQLLTYYSKEFNVSQLIAKRCLDVVGSLVGLAITVVLFPFIALAIRLDSPGPLFFGQTRMGENGRLFRCWKFRSMYIDAEARKQSLMAKNEMKGAMFKIADDPRVTKVGSFIRKCSIDELPQFWNVLKGEMSLVGTRPPTPDEVSNYEQWHRKRISIKPGITGLWQVSGRNQIQDFDKVAALDIQYIDNWTVWMDIRILLKTIKVVFVRDGAS